MSDSPTTTVVYFERRKDEPDKHLHIVSVREGIYIPADRVFLYSTIGRMPGSFKLSDDPEWSEEIERVLSGSGKNNSDVQYRNVRRIGADPKKVADLLEKARQEIALREQVASGLKELIEPE